MDRLGPATTNPSLHTAPSILITGAAGGLGRALCAQYAQNDACTLWLVDRPGSAIETYAAELRTMGCTTTGFELDLTSPDGVDTLFRQVVAARAAENPLPTTLINAAGVFLYKSFLDITHTEWLTTLNVQLSLPFMLTQGFARMLLDAGKSAQGSIVHLSSIHADIGDGMLVPQCASKAGVEGLVRASAEALRSIGIRVNAVAPGGIKPGTPDTPSSGLETNVTQNDIARLAISLASPQHAFLTGTIVDAHGATSAVVRST